MQELYYWCQSLFIAAMQKRIAPIAFRWQNFVDSYLAASSYEVQVAQRMWAQGVTIGILVTEPHFSHFWLLVLELAAMALSIL